MVKADLGICDHITSIARYLMLVCFIFSAAGCIQVEYTSFDTADHDKDKAMSETSVEYSKDAPPRKVVVGTCCYSLWGEYPGVTARIKELGELVDRMSAQSKSAYGEGLDLAILPESAVSPSLRPPLEKVAMNLEGPVLDGFAEIAHRNNCYIVVPMFLTESEFTGGKAGTFSNSAVLIDRKGELVGIYRKIHPVAGLNSDVLELGVTPGVSAPVFDCDFGRVGVQICFDVAYDDGWDALAAAGAEIVAWPTMSPGKIKTSMRSLRGGYYVVSSTWRNNAGVFDPLGEMIATVGPDEKVLVNRLDLEYRLIPWQATLRNGAAFDEKFPGKVEYRYSEAEDGGIFWSNDPEMPIGKMVEQLGMYRNDEIYDYNTTMQDKYRPDK